jgi:hypothetical protein
MFISIEEARKLPSPMRFPLVVRLSALASFVLEGMDRNRWKCLIHGLILISLAIQGANLVFLFV